MARGFVSGSSQYLERLLTGVSPAIPLTIAGWFKPSGVTSTAQAVIALTSSTVGTSRAAIAGIPTTANLYGQVQDAGNFDQFPLTYANGSWLFVALRLTSATARDLTLAAARALGSAVSITPTTINILSVGRINAAGSVSSYYDGAVAEIALWNVALSDAELTTLASSVYPNQVRPGALLGYWPLQGTASPEPDLVGGNPLAVNGATAAPHPPMINAGGSGVAGRMFAVF